ncbi:putative endonuclease [Agrobacterium vitis]|nr:putative endonuclease [Agrobacterium vitis]MBE1437306.1 putative endonuclease [Agrobacterium vitis]
MTPKPTIDAKRKKAERRGRWSEYGAALYLLLKGYRIVALRHKTKWGEIDIIARRGDVVAFVEVKARSTRQLAIDAVGYESQRRIRAAGDVWLSRQPDAARLSQRCDIIAIVPGSWPFHLTDAF